MSSGPPPGLDLNADIKQTIISPVIALMILAGLSVALRITSNIASKGSLQLDDYFILVALVVAWGTGALTIFACYEGIGKHIWNPTVQLETIVKILWASEFLYGTVIPLTKLSIIFFYYRLFPVPFFRRLLHLVLFLVIGWWIAIIVVAIVQCQPYSYFWKQYVDQNSTGRCINIPSFFIGNGGASVVTDFLILITPIPLVWGLQMPVMQRLTVLCIFFLGGFVCIAGVIRIHVLTQMFKSEDLTWNMSQAFIWSSVEPNIGIFCACMPTFRPLIRRWLPQWFGGGSTGHGTDRLRQHSQTGDFYALRDRMRDAHKGKYDDELGLTDEFMSGRHRAPQEMDTQNSIMVRRDIQWSSTPGLNT